MFSENKCLSIGNQFDNFTTFSYQRTISNTPTYEGGSPRSMSNLSVSKCYIKIVLYISLSYNISNGFYWMWLLDHRGWVVQMYILMSDCLISEEPERFYLWMQTIHKLPNSLLILITTCSYQYPAIDTLAKQ